MNSKSIAFLYAAAFLLTGCAPHSPIDAKKAESSQTKNDGSKNAFMQQLTDKDIFGNEATLSVTEEDIQAALEENDFRVPRNSSVILVQSGSRAPEVTMQQEMSKYYVIATFSGIPDRQKAATCNRDKDDSKDIAVAENMNWMQALRYVAAKGHQKAIIVYQDTLQSGKYDSAAKTTIWSDYKNEKLTDTTSLRYLVRFTLVDVATGEWATWSPMNYEYNILSSPSGKNNISAAEITEQQITQLKQKTYAAMMKDLVNRYQ